MKEAHVHVLPATGEPFVRALSQGQTTIGSGADVTIRIADPELARCHAVIHRTDDGWVVVRQAMPFLVNGHRAQKHVLAPFDLVTMGQTAVSFRRGKLPARPDGRQSALELCLGLNDLTSRARQNADRSGLSQLLVDEVARMAAADRVALLAFRSETPEMISLAEAKRGEFSGPEVAFSRTLVTRVLDQNAAVLIHDATGEAELASIPSTQHESTRAIVCVPVRAQSRVIGALYVASSRPHAFTTEQVELITLYAHHALQILEVVQLEQTATTALARLDTPPTSALIGTSPHMAEVRAQIRKIAAHDIDVLIRGDTGTGKEVVARELHQLSDRKMAPFVAVDCGAISEGLFESEMFGHKKGSFTNAYQDRLGWVRKAHGGTLFLDEVGELSLSHQAKLLRVLQTRQVAPVGEDEVFDVNLRLVAATNRDLEKEVSAGRFREDLFYRLGSVIVILPPLRERGEDVLELAHLLLRRHNEALGRRARFSADALIAMRKSAWPGNVRQLEAAIRRSVVLAESDTIGPAELGLASPDHRVSETLPLSVARDRYLKRYVSAVVDETGGDRTEAAKRLMVSVRTVFKYLDEV